MQKIMLLLLLASSLAGFSQKTAAETETKAVAALLDEWHKAAADGDFEKYFGKLSDNSIFIGTDATENWNKKEFMAFAKPYFDRGKAWDFKILERNIYFSPDKKLVWFDELLDTWMKICRGSGVAEKKDGVWKIRHYVLSMTVPNENANEVAKFKEAIENKVIESLKKSR